MTAVLETKLGEPVDRVDGLRKVTGAAPYPADVTFPRLAHAALVQSTIAAGTISRIDAGDAEATPGVLAVLTHKNRPALAKGPMTPLGPTPPLALEDNRVLHHGQHLAIVVAQTREQAAAAARLVKIGYEETAPVLEIDEPRAPVVRNPWGMEAQRGDVAAALASAEAVYDEWFTIAAETNNPLGLFATVARWDGDRLTVHDSTQAPMMLRQSLATVFDLPEQDVRVLVPYLGGGFGAGLRAWPHVILTALASRVVDRPVKLVLTRPQMFTSVGHRPATLQHLRVQERAVAREDAWRRRVDQHALVLDPPGWLLAELGPVPTDPGERRVWRVAAAELDSYRRAYGLDHTEPAKHRWGRMARDGRPGTPATSPIAARADGTRGQPGRRSRAPGPDRRGDPGRPVVVGDQRRRVDSKRLLGVQPRRPASGRRRDWQTAQVALERLVAWDRHRGQRHPDRDRPGRLDHSLARQERDGR